MTNVTGSPTPDRYVRQRILPGFGHDGQAALTSARVLVVGAGGLGSIVIPSLAAAGVGTIGIVDFDTVEPNNLHRQLIHRTEDSGSLKTTSAAARVAALNPGVSVVQHSEKLTSHNALELCSSYDLVIDGCDNFETRYLVNDAALLAGIPAVWGAVSQFAGQVGVAWAARGPHYRDLFPDAPSDGSVLSCAVGGVFPTTVAVIGSIMASEALKIITGIGTPLIGRVITFDALTGSFREIEYASDPDSEPVTALVPSVDADREETSADSPAGRIGVFEVNAVSLAAELENGLAGGAAAALAASTSAIAPVLIDVREPWEVEIARLPGAVTIPLGQLAEAIPKLQGTEQIVVYCHHGVRSAQALALLKSHGFDSARHLVGGIDAWALQIDPTMDRY
ncbi:MAG: ThiF family adenylyltransferase [Microbacteriaceae bacterium]